MTATLAEVVEVALLEAPVMLVAEEEEEALVEALLAELVAAIIVLECRDMD